MVTGLLNLYCGAHLVQSYWQESNISDTNCLRHPFLSYFNNMWLSVRRHQMANLHILKKLEYLWNEKRYLKIEKRILLLVQLTCLRFQNGLDRKDAF